MRHTGESALHFSCLRTELVISNYVHHVIIVLTLWLACFVILIKILFFTFRERVCSLSRTVGIGRRVAGSLY